ncbi:hypothetical protein SAMN05421676_10730 [Salinibacillus kushneri]|uniref:Uncharacterized protein n=1 Tax=Salinibacillus kushneri TaxID=237682 RepID=A0A1I0GIU7_9BACI|nr:hypothetical protein [Salinibacillus kushneri]SET71088.1 hypothetical protein SAMN05421676_10730 [Salinibacillus kushneri]
MKDYFNYRFKDIMRTLLAVGIGFLAAFIFSDIEGDHVILLWITAGLVIAEIIQYYKWRNDKKRTK